MPKAIVERSIIRATRETPCVSCPWPVRPGELTEVLRRGVYAHASHQQVPVGVEDPVVEKHRALIRKVICPACGANVGIPCKDGGVRRAANHQERVARYSEMKRRRRWAKARAAQGTR